MMRYYDFNTPRRTRRRVKRKNVKVTAFMLLAFILLPTIIGLYVFNKEQFTTDAQTIAVSLTPAPSLTPSPTLAKISPLESVVQPELADTNGKYSIEIKNLQTGEAYAYNEHHIYQSASLYKLWIMAVAYNQMQQGKIKESDVLSSSVETLNNKFNIASDSADLTDGTVTFPVNQALLQMITISHNYAALLLAQKVGLSNVTAFLKAHNYNQSKVGQPPMTSAYDMEKFLEDLYYGKLADKQTTNTMLELLKEQKLNNKLPKNLPSEVEIAHKTGELGQVTHDAGIVYTDKGDYIIVVMSESANPAAAEDRIADISKEVYDYFSE